MSSTRSEIEAKLSDADHHENWPITTEISQSTTPTIIQALNATRVLASDDVGKSQFEESAYSNSFTLKTGDPSPANPSPEVMRTAAILLDIDDTLIDFKASETNVVWMGSLQLWQDYLDLLQKTCREAKIDLHYGIATFKKSNNGSGLKGDFISATVLEETERAGIKYGCGLRKWINKELEFFTSTQCKVKNALDKVPDILAGISKKDIFIVDDLQTDVCDVALNAGYSAVCVGNVALLTDEGRLSRIANTFIKIFSAFGLTAPAAMTATAKLPEKTLKQEEQEKKELQQNRYRLQHKKPHIQIHTKEDLIGEDIQPIEADVVSSSHDESTVSLFCLAGHSAKR